MEEGLADPNGNTITKMKRKQKHKFLLEVVHACPKDSNKPQTRAKQNNWKFRTNVSTLLIGNSKSDFGLRET